GMRAAGMMRRSLTEALFIARHRVAFGKPLIELPLMRRQLLKIMLLAESARSVMLHATGELERADGGDESARRRIRILTPLLKFRACRDARRATGDARRLLLSALVLEHRLKPRDPLLSASQDEPFANLLLPETPVSAGAADPLLNR